MALHIFADGASKGNPGLASIGAVCFDVEKRADVPDLEGFLSDRSAAQFTVSKKIGDKKTNNEAEYLALIEALKQVKKGQGKLHIFIDSLLVVEQIKGNYKVKNARLKPLWQEAKSLLPDDGFTITHIPREKNQIADYLANEALK